MDRSHLVFKADAVVEVSSTGVELRRLARADVAAQQRMLAAQQRQLGRFTTLMDEAKTAEQQQLG